MKKFGKQKGFSLVVIVLVFFMVFVALAFVSMSFLSESSKKVEQQELQNELSKIQLPPTFKEVGRTHRQSGIDNDADISVTYNVQGTRDEVFKYVVNSLKLNPADHQHSTDQELHGVGSPEFKYTYYLYQLPFIELQGIDKCPSTPPNFEDYYSCIKEAELARSKLPASQVEIIIQKR